MGTPNEKLVLNKKALAIWVVVALAVAAGITAIAIANSPENVAQRAIAHRLENAPTYAEIECESQVRTRLKAPSTAVFSGTLAVANTDGDYDVTGNVDSENSFGAALRSSFSCIVSVGEEVTTTQEVTIN